MCASATFSACRQWRYSLSRIWDDSLPRCVFVCLNPSTADESKDDNTIRKCVKFAQRWGYGSFHMLNVFAWRSTDPKVLPGVDDPIGPDNNAAILSETAKAGIVVCAWGRHASLKGRGAEVLRMLNLAGVGTYALKLNKDGSPMHPLYIRDDTTPIRIEDMAA